jgi:hypothetical protein
MRNPCPQHHNMLSVDEPANLPLMHLSYTQNDQSMDLNNLLGMFPVEDDRSQEYMFHLLGRIVRRNRYIEQGRQKSR